MKPFDLEAALRGEPVVTRDGQPVTQVTKFDAPEEQLPIYAVIDEEVHSFTNDGFYFPDNDDSPCDLFMATKTVKKEGWVNLYKNYDSFRQVLVSHCYSTEAEAKAKRHKPISDLYIATVKIEWEEEI